MAECSRSRSSGRAPQPARACAGLLLALLACTERHDPGQPPQSLQMDDVPRASQVTNPMPENRAETASPPGPSRAQDPDAPLDPDAPTRTSVATMTAGAGGASVEQPGDAGPSEEQPMRATPPIVALDTSMGTTCVVLEGGLVKCWGDSAYGALGVPGSTARGDEPGEMSDALPAIDLGTGVRVRAVAAGKWNTCALTDDARIKCWGINARSNIGTGTEALGDEPNEMGDALPFIPLPETDEPVAIDVCESRGCAVLRAGTVRCWGITGPEETGPQTLLFDFGPGEAVRAISVREDHSCALTESGSVRCWGGNYWGQLGTGDNAARVQWTDAVPVDLGEGRRAIAISVGATHVCALLEGGAVKCWGNNDYGQLGLGDLEWRGDQQWETGDGLPEVQLGSGRHAIQISAGMLFTCALLDDATVKCWGGERVQWGLEGEWVHGDGPFEMGDALPHIYLGRGLRPTAISVGDGHACAVLDDADIKCWGLNLSGQLGLGDTEERGDEPGEMGESLPKVDIGGTLLQ